MSEENGKPPETPPQAQGTPAAEPKPMTADDFARERDRMFADMRRMVEGLVKPKNGKGKESPEPEASAPQAPDVTELFNRERTISEAFDDHPHLSREHKKVLRKLIDAERPDDVAGYVAAQAKLFASGNPSTPPAAPIGRPVSDAGAPSSAPAFTEDTPLWKLDKLSRDRLIQEKGLHWYRQTLRHQAKGVKIRLR